MKTQNTIILRTPGKALICLALITASFTNSNAACQASFTANGSNDGSGSVSFTNTSTGTNPSYTHYYWNFGGQGYSYVQNPSFTFSHTGLYPVCLSILDSITNCDSYFCDTVYVYVDTVSETSCKAGFTANASGDGDGLVSFTNTSSGTNPSYTRYYWNFGGQGYSYVQNPSFTFSHTGLYPVCLSILDSITNCDSYFCDTVYVYVDSSVCNASFSYYTNGNQITVTSTSTGNYAGEYWHFGDNSGWVKATTNPFTHTYNSEGEYWVNLGLGDSLLPYRCDSAIKIVTIGDDNSSFNCEADFEFYDSGNGTLAFTNLSSGEWQGNSNHYYFSWVFGDGSYSSEANPLYHTYADSNVYNVCMTMYYIDSLHPENNCNDEVCKYVYSSGGSSSSGCTQSVSLNIKITDMHNGTLSVTDNSTYPTSSYAAGYYFSDGTYETRDNTHIGNFTHHPTVNGLLQAWFWVYSYDWNCYDYYSVNLMINDSSLSDCRAYYEVYSYEDSTNSAKYAYIWNLSSPNDSGTAYLWDFGDGFTSTDAYPFHNYQNPGNYLLCLTVNNGSDGCTDTYCGDTIVVNKQITGIDGLFVKKPQPPTPGSTPTGIKATVTPEEIEAVEVYPNYVVDNTNLVIDVKQAGKVNISIVNVVGQSISVQTLNLNPGKNTHIINAAAMPAGVYYVNVIGNNKNLGTVKFVR